MFTEHPQHQQGKQSVADIAPEYQTKTVVRDQFIKLQNCIEQHILGQEHLVERIIIALLADGHLLVEGVPGLAKTQAIQTMARYIDASFQRIQFTPDMLPADITGTDIFHPQTADFSFQSGPVFHNIILADEINRAPAKVQSALLEAMAERQVSAGKKTYPLDDLFLVMATRNPIEQEGTFPLPEAQLDRFLFKIVIDYPTLEQEEQILQRYKNTSLAPDLSSISKVFSTADLKKIQKLVAEIKIEDQLLSYIAKITHGTRKHAKLYLGASPRASLAMAKAAKAMAAIRGRDFITPDDVQAVFPAVAGHRLKASKAQNSELLVQRVLDSVAVIEGA